MSMTFWAVRFYLVTAGIALALLWALAIWESLRQSRRERKAARDSVAYLDQWTERRRQRLADIQQPAERGFNARRHTVVGHKEQP